MAYGKHVTVLGGPPGAGTGNLGEKRGHSFEVYNDPTPVTTGEEIGPAGVVTATSSPTATMRRTSTAVA